MWRKHLWRHATPHGLLLITIGAAVDAVDLHAANDSMGFEPERCYSEIATH